MDPQHANSTAKFNGIRDEWSEWSLEFILHMEAQGLGYILDETDVVKQQQSDFRNHNRIVWSILLTSLTNPVRKWLMGESQMDKKDGREAWRILKQYYEKRDPRMITKLNFKLLDSKFTTDMDPTEFAVDFKQTVNKLKSYGHTLDEYIICDIFMRAIDGRDSYWSQWIQMIQELRNENEEEFTYE